MSCIEISVKRVGSSLGCPANRVGGPMECSADRVGRPMECSADRVGRPMQISAGLVCTVNGEFFLRVSPDVIWLDPNDATVYVESNVNWIIE